MCVCERERGSVSRVEREIQRDTETGPSTVVEALGV